MTMFFQFNGATGVRRQPRQWRQDSRMEGRARWRAQDIVEMEKRVRRPTGGRYQAGSCGVSSDRLKGAVVWQPIAAASRQAKPSPLLRYAGRPFRQRVPP